MKEIFENLVVPKRILNGDAAEQNTELGTNRRVDTLSSFVEYPEAENDGMTRREFIKTMVAFLGGVAAFGLSACKNKDSQMEEIDADHLPPNFWFKVMKKIYERFGDDPSPMQIRAHAIIQALGIPSGQVSALTSTPDAVRTAPQADEVLAKCLTNDAGVEIMPEHIASSDILDLYPKGLSEELKAQLDPEVCEMFELRYEHAKELYREYGETQDYEIALNQESYFQLPGGIDLLAVGYTHAGKYQDVHGDYLERLAHSASVIAVEKFADVPYGSSLEMRFETEEGQQGHYDVFMHRARKAGFRGLFAEVDARDTHQNIEKFMKWDQTNPTSFMKEFYEKYFNYIKKEHPALSNEIRTKERFEMLLNRQLTSIPNVEKFHNARVFVDNKPVEADGVYVPDPAGFEFGQMMYSDALSAIKLHLIAKMMADGQIKKGPILDIQGVAHLSNKSLFIRYPEYAMEVVLRTLPELMSFRGLAGIIVTELDNPDWPEVVRQIAKLAFAKTTDNPENIEPFIYDYLKEYGIDPEKVIPSDEEVQEIMEKTRHSAEIRRQEKERE